MATMTGHEKSMLVTELTKKNFSTDLLQYVNLTVRHSQMRNNAIEVEVALHSAKYGSVNNYRFVSGRIMNFIWDLNLTFGPNEFQEDAVTLSEEAPEGINKGGKTTVISFLIG